MQGLSASCLQQRFVLTRCCDSSDKKPRRRKTRVERRTMVESFINKYRISNNGNFPSLNLTHKEVGGSFYIVREIVRDIIQENRVLGPGSPSMKGLTLQDCLEEHDTEFLESSIGIVVDAKQIETSSQLYSNSDTDKEQIFSSDQENHAIFSHVMHHGHSCLQGNSRDADDHRSLVTIESQEMAMGMSSLETEINGEIGLQVQDHQVEHPKPLHEVVSQEILDANEDSQANCMILTEAAKMSIDDDEKYKTTATGDLPEEKGLLSSSTTSDHLFSNLLSSEEEFPSLVSSSTESGSDSACLRVDELIGHQEALSIQSLPNEQGESSVQIENISILNRTEQIENPFSILNKEVPQPTPSGSRTSCFPAPGIPCSEEPPARRVHSTESTRPNPERVVAESLASSPQEISASQLKEQHETDCSSTDKGSRSSSIAANGSEEVLSEGNLVWNAIKVFVAALIKFWAQ